VEYSCFCLNPQDYASVSAVLGFVGFYGMIEFLMWKPNKKVNAVSKVFGVINAWSMLTLMRSKAALSPGYAGRK
jgi:hypothetical protein